MPDGDKKRHLLLIERLDTVGFVDAGMNPDADILIWKRNPGRNPKEDDMPFDPKKLSDEAQAHLADLEKKQADELAKRDEELKKAQEALEALKAKVAELEAAAGGDEDDDEDDELMKGLTGEARKAVEAILAKREKDQEERIAKAEKLANDAIEKAQEERKQRQMVEFRKQADEELGYLQGEKEDKAVLLFTMSEKLDKDTMKGITDMLRAASAQVEKAALLTKELGESGDDDDPQSPWNQVLDLAKKEQEKDSSLTSQKAVAKVLQENPKLAAATRN